MKEKEQIKTQRGIFNLPGNMAFPNDKVLQIFTKLKRRTNSAPSVPPGPGDAGTPIRELEPNIAELQQGSMNSHHIGPRVIKTERGFEVM